MLMWLCVLILYQFRPSQNVNRCPPLKRFSPLSGRNQNEPPFKKHRDNLSYSVMHSLKESNFNKNSSLTVEERSSVELKG